ncbi:MAG: hypothetical protein CMJ64_13585 [Planctomycetaceae bacterium]|nr:hypothetical protein [Planctomycetaceae bacterium]
MSLWKCSHWCDRIVSNRPILQPDSPPRKSEKLNAAIQCRVSGEAGLKMPELLSDRSPAGDTHVWREIGLPPSNRNA